MKEVVVGIAMLIVGAVSAQFFEVPWVTKDDLMKLELKITQLDAKLDTIIAEMRK